jgi:hypothetical protein
VFTLFAAPINKSSLEFDNKEMIYQADKSATSNNYTDFSTGYQSMIQYFFSLSSNFADRAAALSTYSFAGYLESKNEVLLNKDDYFKQIKDIYEQMHNADLYSRFYRDICVQAYNGYWNKKNTFLETKQSSREFKITSDKKQQLYDIFGAELTLQTCQKAERKAISLTIGSIDNYFALQTRLILLGEGGLENHKIAMNAVVNNMFRSQRDLGWVNVISIPFSYYLFDQADLYADSENSSSKFDDIAKKVTNQKYLIEEGNFAQKISSSLEKTTGSMIGSLLGYQLLSFFPGFSAIKNDITDLLKTFSSPSDETFVRKVKNFATKIVKGPISYMLDKVLGSIATLSQVVVIFIATYFLAASIYLAILKMLLAVVVALFGLIRIIFYYLSSLKYFLMAPAVAVWGITTRQSSKVIDFIGQGAILFVQPLLIVVSISIFIFANEFLLTMYSYLLGLIIHNTQANYVTMTAIAEDNVISSISTYSIFTAMDIVFQTILSFLSLLLAYKIVFSDEWFMGLFGWDKNNAGAGGSRSVGESAGRMINPIGR